MDHSELWKELNHIESLSHIEEHKTCYMIVFKKEGNVPQRTIIEKEPHQKDLGFLCSECFNGM